MQYWFIKSEPEKYPWSQLLKDGQTYWDGIRNYQARNYLQEMKLGDRCLFYHSNEGKEVVGIVQVIKEAYQDPTTEEKAWVVVDIAPVKSLPKPVSLATLRSHPILQNLNIFRQIRLSVVKVTEEEFFTILDLGGLNL